MEERDRQAAREVHCPNCGAPNPAQAVYCSACGSRLPEPVASEDETLIDVSSGQPRVLVEEQLSGSGSSGPGGVQGGFTTVRFEQGRVFVTQGNRRNCLIGAVVGLLLLCCACWFLWVIPANVF